MKNTVLKLVIALILILPLSVHAKVRIVATTQDLAAIAHAIGGNLVTIDSLTRGTRDPHFAQAKPSMIRRVYRADLLLLIGAEMEIGWLPPLLQSARNGKVLPGNPGYLDLSLTVPLLGKPKGAVTRDMGDVHAQGNPHYWLNPENGLLIANAIAQRLSEIDADNTATFQKNFKDFQAKLTNKIAQWKLSLSSLKEKPIISYHTSFIYLADIFGFRIVNQVEPKPGISPTASHLNELVSQINRDKIKLLIIEPYYERKSADYLKKQTGIQVIVVPQSVGAKDNIKDYFDLFDSIVDAFRKGVK